MFKFKLIVAGGRNFTDYDLMRNTLDKIIDTKLKEFEIVIMTGGATGAAALGMLYAHEREYAVEVTNTNWDLHGESAGYKRNTEMIETSHGSVVFWNGDSKCSKHMIDITIKAGKPCLVVPYAETKPLFNSSNN
jgi:uncharacterized Rmd1/YagE family protein